MNISISIRASVFPNRGVELRFDQHLEVSLDCAQCGRTDRTVVFGLPDEQGRCTTGHGFPGHIGNVQVNDSGGLLQREIECSFRLSYEYSPVKDSKYPNCTSSAIPTWGRVHFKVTCPKCHKTSKRSIQNNMVRPWSCVCKCGYELYKEKVPYPTFSLTPSDA